MTAQMSRGAARKLTVVMASIVVIGVIGMGALAIGGEGALPTPPTPKPIDLAPVEPEGQATEPRISNEEWKEEVAFGLTDAHQWAVEETDVVETGDDGAHEVAMTPTAPIRYLGSIIGPERRLAIVSIDGKQRILAENADVGGYRLQRVEDDHIVVRRGAGQPTQVDKAASDGTMLTTIAAKPGVDDGRNAGRMIDEDMDNLTRIERQREEALARQRERLGDRTERLEAIEQRRNGANVNGVKGMAPANRGGGTTPAGNYSTGATGSTGSTGASGAATRPPRGNEEDH